MRLDAGRPLGPLDAGLPVSVDARSEAGGRIAVDGVDVVAAPGAVALAVLTPDGTIARTGVADPTDQLRVSFAADSPLFRVVDLRECRDVGNLGWQDVTSMAWNGQIAVRIDNYRPFDTRIRFLVGGDTAISPRLATWKGPGTPRLAVGAAAEDAVAALGVAGATALANLRVTLVDIRVNDEGQDETLSVDFGGPVRAVYGAVSVDLNNPRRATLCSEAPWRP